MSLAGWLQLDVSTPAAAVHAWQRLLFPQQCQQHVTSACRLVLPQCKIWQRCLKPSWSLSI